MADLSDLWARARFCARLIGLAAVAQAARQAPAATQYNLVMLNANPFGGGQAFGIDNGHAVGDVQGPGGVVWTDPTHYTVLSPTSAGSIVNAISGNQQVGWIPISNQEHAALWTGTAASVANLSPTPTTVCYATATDGAQQVGVISGPTAALWSGTAASFVSLNPTNFFESTATGVANGVQVGYGRYIGGEVALAWHGTAASATILGTGEALGIAPDGQIVGIGQSGGAAMWRDGTAGSLVNMAPLNTATSELRSTNGINQVGDVSFGSSDFHAGVWAGTADSFQMLPVPFGDTYSIAYAIDAQGGIAGVVGSGNSEVIPVIWQPVPEPSSVAIFVLTNSALACRRRYSQPGR